MKDFSDSVGDIAVLLCLSHDFYANVDCYQKPKTQRNMNCLSKYLWLAEWKYQQTNIDIELMPLVMLSFDCNEFARFSRATSTEGEKKFQHEEFRHGFHPYLIDLIKQIDEFILLNENVNNITLGSCSGISEC